MPVVTSRKRHSKKYSCQIRPACAACTGCRGRESCKIEREFSREFSIRRTLRVGSTYKSQFRSSFPGCRGIREFHGTFLFGRAMIGRRDGAGGRPTGGAAGKSQFHNGSDGVQAQPPDFRTAPIFVAFDFQVAISRFNLPHEPSIVGQRTFVIEIATAMVRQPDSGDLADHRPRLQPPCRQERIRRCLDHQVQMRMVDPIMPQHDISQAMRTGGGMYWLRTRPLGSLLLFRSHG